MLNITQDDYNVIKQRTQTRYIKLEILDFQYRVVDEISGNLLGYSGSIDATSDLRRSCQVEVAVFGPNVSKFNIQAGSEIFLDKMIRPYIGLLNNRNQQIQWYSQGIYLINAPSWDWDAQTNTLKFQGLDLMSKLTGARNGQLQGITHTIKAGENVRNAIISTLKMGGFNNYIVEECRLKNGAIQDVPTDIVIEHGGTVYDLLSKLRDILPNYQIYFDIDGVFHYEPIPTGVNEPVSIDDDLLTDVVTSESINTDFEKVKNVVEVYGRSHDVKHYPTEISVDNTTTPVIVTMTIPSLTEIKEGIIIGFTLPESINKRIVLNVNGVDGVLFNKDGTRATHLFANEYYVAKAIEDNDWEYMGHQQAQATAVDDNPDSPFYTGGPVGEIRIVLSGGEFDNIQSDELAQQRADYELYQRSRLQDTISLYMMPIPWIDVNLLISHVAKDETEAKLYMIDTVSIPGDISSSMTIQAHRYYPAQTNILGGNT